MSMIVGTIVAVAVAAEVLYTAVQWLRERWGNRTVAPSTLCTAEMSETDQKMQTETVEIVHEVFGEDINESIQELSASERLEKVELLTEQLKEAYDVDVNVEFFGENRNYCGYYNYKDNTLSLNVADLLSKNIENVYEFINTVIHELRHAVQWKAIQEEDFWEIDDQRKISWINNFADYITAQIDPKGYALQPVEVDARTFAAGCLKGVIENECEA